MQISVAGALLVGCGGSSGSSGDNGSSGGDTKTTSIDVDDALKPFVEALTGRSFGPWTAAESSFAVGSAGLKKWKVLTSKQKVLISANRNKQVEFWKAGKSDGWNVLTFCADSSDEGCYSYAQAPELHLKVEDDLVTDLRFFRGQSDQDTEQKVETSFYSITSSEDFEFLKIDVVAALQEADGNNGAESACMLGEIDATGVEEVYYALRLYTTALTGDGLDLEPSSAEPSIMEMANAEVAPFMICFDYELSELTSLEIRAGELRFDLNGDSYSNKSAIVINLKLTDLAATSKT